MFQYYTDIVVYLLKSLFIIFCNFQNQINEKLQIVLFNELIDPLIRKSIYNKIEIIKMKLLLFIIILTEIAFMFLIIDLNYHTNLQFSFFFYLVIIHQISFSLLNIKLFSNACLLRFYKKNYMLGRNVAVVFSNKIFNHYVSKLFANLEEHDHY